MPVDGFASRQTSVACGMLRAASHRPTRSASAALSGRRRWSTVNAHAVPPRSRAQRSARIVSARLSGPPETPTASDGRGSNPPIAASAASSAAAGSIGVGGSAAAKPLLLGAGALPDCRRRIGEALVELVERQTSVLFLIGLGQRHAEIQQIVRSLRPFREALVAFGERGGGVLIAVAREIGLPQPILRVARQRVVRM